jgi:hypothetical protein
MPVAKVQFSICGRTVTCKLGATVRCQYGLCLLKKYMYNCFYWTNDTTELVSWDAFACGFRSRYEVVFLVPPNRQNPA